MIIDFNKLIEFNNKHPDTPINPFHFVFINMAVSEDVTEEIIEEYVSIADTEPDWLHLSLESRGFVKVIGGRYKDISIRDLGLELIGQSKSDTIIELAEKIREMFPKGVKSGGKLVRSSSADIADKLRKFFKKHKYTQEQVLEATKRYLNEFRRKDWAYMQAAVYFIEKDGSSTLAAECDNLRDGSVEPEAVDTMRRL
jgi:hypothetical protein